MNAMPWKPRLLLAVLALGTVAGYGSALARHHHGPCAGGCHRPETGGCHGPTEKP